MKKSVTVLTLLLVFLVAPFAPSAEKPAPSPQKTDPQTLSSRVPPATPEDVKSIDAIVAAVYNVISGPAGPRDWNRFRSLFIPEARLTSATKSNDPAAPSVSLLTVDGYVQGAGDYFNKNGFFETAIVNKVQKFGNIAQVFTSYESRHAASDKPFTRGINSMQLLFDGSRWWVLSILWDEESPTNPLPAEMATRSKSPIRP